MLTDAGVLKMVDLGSDHRAVGVCLGIRHAKSMGRRRPHSPKKPIKGWTQESADEHGNELDRKVGDLMTEA